MNETGRAGSPRRRQAALKLGKQPEGGGASSRRGEASNLMGPASSRTARQAAGRPGKQPDGQASSLKKLGKQPEGQASSLKKFQQAAERGRQAA